MLFLTKECDYGVRIVRALADGEKKTVRAICDREVIPHPYAYKILKKLEHAGLVQSQQGPSGGYRLMAALNAFTLYDVVTAVDENLLFFECLRDKHQCTHNQADLPCAVHREFCRLQSVMVAEMRSRTMDRVLSNEGA